MARAALTDGRRVFEPEGLRGGDIMYIEISRYVRVVVVSSELAILACPSTSRPLLMLLDPLAVYRPGTAQKIQRCDPADSCTRRMATYLLCGRSGPGPARRARAGARGGRAALRVSRASGEMLSV